MENRVRNRIKVIWKEQKASEYRIKAAIVGCLTNGALFWIHEAALARKMPTICKWTGNNVASWAPNPLLTNLGNESDGLRCKLAPSKNFPGTSKKESFVANFKPSSFCLWKHHQQAQLSASALATGKGEDVIIFTIGLRLHAASMFISTHMTTPWAPIVVTRSRCSGCCAPKQLGVSGTVTTSPLTLVRFHNWISVL